MGYSSARSLAQNVAALTTSQVVQWWELRRLLYNAVLLVVGVGVVQTRNQQSSSRFPKRMKRRERVDSKMRRTSKNRSLETMGRNTISTSSRTAMSRFSEKVAWVKGLKLGLTSRISLENGGCDGQNRRAYFCQLFGSLPLD